MKYLFLILCFLIGCDRAPNQEEIVREAWRYSVLKESCANIANAAGTKWMVELPDTYGPGHYICNLIDHEHNIFRSFEPIELSAIGTFLLIKQKELDK